MDKPIYMDQRGTRYSVTLEGHDITVKATEINWRTRTFPTQDDARVAFFSLPNNVEPLSHGKITNEGQYPLVRFPFAKDWGRLR